MVKSGNKGKRLRVGIRGRVKGGEKRRAKSAPPVTLPPSRLFPLLTLPFFPPLTLAPYSHP
jgi:hypothetical protein